MAAASNAKAPAADRRDTVVSDVSFGIRHHPFHQRVVLVIDVTKLAIVAHPPRGMAGGA
jgi:hypothetical protein